MSHNFSWTRNDLTARSQIQEAQTQNPQTTLFVSDSLPNYDAALQALEKHVAKIYYNRKPKGPALPRGVVENTVIISHEGEVAYVYRSLEEMVLVEEVGVITVEELAYLISRYADSPAICVYNRLRIIPFSQLVEALMPLVGKNEIYHIKCGKDNFKAYIECRFKYLKRRLRWFDRNFRSLSRLKNAFKLLSISYNLLKVHRILGCTPFEAGGVKKLDYYEVWDKLLR